MSKVFTIISHYRSGTSYFCQLIKKNFENVNMNFEIYSSPYQINIFTRRKVEAELGFANEELRNYAKEFPLDYLDCIINHNSKSQNVTGFKLFHNHLDWEKAEMVIKRTDFVIFLHRNFLDIYISFIKARLIGKFARVDTSNTKIQFDSKEFEEIENNYNTWMQKTRALVEKQNIPFVNIHYSTFHKMDFDEKIDFLKTLLESKLQLPIIIGNSSLNQRPIRLLFKQDQSKSYNESIENYKEFEDYILNFTNYNLNLESF